MLDLSLTPSLVQPDENNIRRTHFGHKPITSPGRKLEFGSRSGFCKPASSYYLRGAHSQVRFHLPCWIISARNSGLYRLIDIDTSSGRSLLPDQVSTKPGEVQFAWDLQYVRVPNGIPHGQMVIFQAGKSLSPPLPSPASASSSNTFCGSKAAASPTGSSCTSLSFLPTALDLILAFSIVSDA